MSEREKEEMAKAAEDEKFKAWVRTLDHLPAEVPGRENWNAAVIMDAIDKLSQPSDPRR